MNFPVDLRPYQAYIFHLDGTLIDSMPWHVRAWEQVGREHGFTIEPETIYAMGGVSSRDVVLHYKNLGCDVGDVDAFVRRKVALYRENIDKVALFEDIYAILKEGRERGVKIAIGSGTQRLNADTILQLRGIASEIDAVVCGDDVINHKPHPDTFLKAAELLGVEPQACLVFEDGAPGFEAARRARMDCVRVERGAFRAFTPRS